MLYLVYSFNKPPLLGCICPQLVLLHNLKDSCHSYVLSCLKSDICTVLNKPHTVLATLNVSLPIPLTSSCGWGYPCRVAGRRTVQAELKTNVVVLWGRVRNERRDKMRL